MSGGTLWRWVPAALLAAGALLTLGVDRQKGVPLRQDLGENVPATIQRYTGEDLAISEEERRVAGVTDYLFRAFRPAEAAPTAPAAFSVYVGYYDQQMQGRTIHSPKNCLPGAGWEVLQSREIAIATPAGPLTANHYLLKRGQQQALVLYWYQGRGRTQSNEYVVKVNLLRDAALRGRSEEALVRIMVPVTGSLNEASDLARQVASEIVGGIEEALPAA